MESQDFQRERPSQGLQDRVDCSKADVNVPEVVELGRGIAPQPDLEFLAFGPLERLGQE